MPAGTSQVNRLQSVVLSKDSSAGWRTSEAGSQVKQAVKYRAEKPIHQLHHPRHWQQDNKRADDIPQQEARELIGLGRGPEHPVHMHPEATGFFNILHAAIIAPVRDPSNNNQSVSRLMNVDGWELIGCVSVRRR